MLKKIIAQALKAGHVFQTSEELAALAASSVKYAGGYGFSGTTWTLDSQELKGICHVEGFHDHGGHEEADTDYNLEVLANAKVGDVLECYVSINGSEQTHQFTKTWDGWICTRSVWHPYHPHDASEVWDAALEVEKEVARHAKALAKAKAKKNAEAQLQAMYSLEARAHLRGV